ncbi:MULTISPECIES: hypothetical protein [unclassified Polaromonas]|uniref:hypothetical protein n=1 Tax=unclassified Polaromonas TaxID=2638319 RepID=UPI0018C9C6C5|nr:MULTISPECIES: hypothetical protein [unclassified Polaromonas]MBG6070811.1 hypothetical protein [Polaromonas sp. CG_9.7]MBG6112879.1 hypothetical protein [Polaromonas sp. CG_9.2]
MENFIAIICFFISFLILCLSGFKFLGVNAHPLAFLIWTQIFVLTVVGVVGLGIFDLPMSYGADLEISQETRVSVITLTFSSLAILFFGLAFLFYTKIFVPLQYDIYQGDVFIVSRLTYVSFLILVLKLISIPEIPFFLALSGDVVAAAEAKVLLLTKQTGITIFGINYILRSFISYIYIASAILYSIDSKNKTIRNLFFINLVLVVLDGLYDVQKQTLVILALATFWIFYIRKGKFLILLKGGFLAAFLVGLMYVLTLDQDLDSSLFVNSLNRIFLAQSEGLFYIRETIDPSLNYMWLGMPLASLIGLPQNDPAAEVVKIFFPTAGDSWLNSNTYFIAHAWSIFGDWAILIGPIFVLLNILIILIVMQALIRIRPVIYYAIAFWFIIKMPVVNLFTEFFWFKVVLDVFVNLIFVFLLVGLVELVCKKSVSKIEVINK